MIKLQDIHLHFGEQAIFNSLSCIINAKDKIGLVGRNGSGKSTLLQVIVGKQSVDSGIIETSKGFKIGYLPQEMTFTSSKTVYEETYTAFSNVQALLEKCRQLEGKLDCPHNIERYAVIQQELAFHDIEKLPMQVKEMLAGLGFSEETINKPVSALSVGWKMRIVLAKLLLQQADFYLFDEPTNHLDIFAKDWFLQFLQQARFGYLLVCHDRYFLDYVCTKILELERGRGTLFVGNYDAYLKQKEERERILQNAIVRQQKERARKLKTIERFRYKASKAKMAQSMIKALDREEILEIETKERTLSFSFPPIQRSGKVVLTVENVAHAFDDKQIFKNVSFEIERGEKVAIIAPNGVGKTTLFNLITGRLSLQKGAVTEGHNVSSAQFEQDQDTVLNKEHSILQEVESVCTSTETRQLVRKILGAFLFSGDTVDKRIGVLSGGEKNRVAMVKVLLQQANFLLLDEPTNHLDLSSKEILLHALQQFPGTILFVSHDRDFIDHLATRILELDQQGVTSYSGNYEFYLYQKEHRQIEIDEKITKTVTPQKKRAATGKEEYKRRKEVSRIEQKIERLENAITHLNNQLATQIYGTDEFSVTIAELQKKQHELEQAFLSWESLIDTVS